MLPEAIGLTPLNAEKRFVLLRWLGDTPFTALTGGQLALGLCHAYIIGDAADPKAALVHPAAEPTEPIAFGSDVESIWTLLSRVSGWDCVNVEPSIAVETATLLAQRIRTPTRIMSERYYVLEHEPVGSVSSAVRRLGPDDEELVDRSDPLFGAFFLGHGDVARSLAKGVVAGVIADGNLVSAVTTSAWSGLHVDLGAATVSAARGRGFAAQAAVVVCNELRASGRKPVWAAGETNRASWRIPEKLGFRFVGRREYVILDGIRPLGFRPS